MNNLSQLEEAIKSRRSIAFHYDREGKTSGERIGDPHAVFIRKRNDGSENVYAHIYQTEGVTDSRQRLPSWRQFFVNDITHIRVLVEQVPFEIADGYNPSSYEFPIAKV